MNELDVTDYMYFGGYPGRHAFSEVTNVDLDGCIDHVQISGTPVDLSQNVEAFEVLAGCPAKVANIVSFQGGKGYVALPGANLENFVQVNFKFKTEEDSGLIFYMANEDQSNLMSLSMLEGALVLRTLPGGDVSSEVQSKLNDGLWHVVTATADGSQIRLDIDDFEVYTLDTPNSQLVFPATPIYFAGIPDNFQLARDAVASTSTFVGCIGDTTINGRLINYASSMDNVGASVAKCPVTGSQPQPDVAQEPRNPKRIEDDSQPTGSESSAPPAPRPVETTTAPVVEITTLAPQTTTTPAPEETTTPELTHSCSLPLEPAGPFFF